MPRRRLATAPSSILFASSPSWGVHLPLRRASLRIRISGRAAILRCFPDSLITRLLSNNETGDLGGDLGVFYIRRTLRIFPLYYLVLVVLLLAGRLPNPWWHFF